MNIEHLFAQQAGTLFQGHRGQPFNKIIQITTNKQLSFPIRILPNSDCEITIRDRENQVGGLHWRTLTVMWINVAATNPATPNQPRMDLKAYLLEILPIHTPDVLLITSTGNGFDAGTLPAIMRATGFSDAYQEKVGRDKGIFCASFTGVGAMWPDQEHGDNIENGIVLEYNWF